MPERLSSIARQSFSANFAVAASRVTVSLVKGSSNLARSTAVLMGVVTVTPARSIRSAECENDLAHGDVLARGEACPSVRGHSELQGVRCRGGTPHPGGGAEFDDQSAGAPTDRGSRTVARGFEFVDRAERVAEVVQFAVESRGLELGPGQVGVGQDEVENGEGDIP